MFGLLTSQLSVAVENSTAFENEARPTTVMQINTEDKKKFVGGDRQCPHALTSPQYCNLVKLGGKKQNKTTQQSGIHIQILITEQSSEAGFYCKHVLEENRRICQFQHAGRQSVSELKGYFTVTPLLANCCVFWGACVNTTESFQIACFRI